MNMPQSDQISNSTNKAHMLIAMLGREFTKSADHPFFEKLNEMVLQPDPKSSPVPTGALERLLAALPAAQSENKTQDSASPKSDESNRQNDQDHKLDANPTIRNLRDQHPAVIAHYLAQNAPSERMNIINALHGKTARQAAVYFNRFFDASSNKR